MKEFLDRIKKIRTEKGISYQAMAYALGFESPASYQKIETGKTNLTIDKLFKIAEYLEVDVGYILGIPTKEVLNQENKDNSVIYSQKIENFYQENKETLQKLLDQKDLLISNLKDEVQFYRELLRNTEKKN